MSILVRSSKIGLEAVRWFIGVHIDQGTLYFPNNKQQTMIS